MSNEHTMDGVPASGTYAVASGDKVKIGKSKNIHERVVDLQCGSPSPLMLVGTSPLDIERNLHRELREHHLYGEWFALGPSTPVLISRLDQHGIDLMEFLSKTGRGTSRSVANSMKTVCKRGHDLTPDNCLPSGVKRGARVCLSCVSEYQRVRYETNRESILAQANTYRDSNRERIKERKRAQYAANRDRIREQQRARRAANPDVARARDRAWKDANREQVNARQRARKASSREHVNAEARAWYAANREKIIAKNRERRAQMTEERRDLERAARRAKYAAKRAA